MEGGKMPQKKVVFIFLSLVLVLALTVFFGACSKTTTVTQTSTATATTTTTTTTKPIELKWTSMWNPDSDDGQADLILADMINSRTGGRVKVTYYGMESLGKSSEWVNMLNGGVADIGSLMLATYPGLFDTELVTDLPMLGIPDRATLVDLAWQLYSKGYFPGFEDFKVLAFKGGTALNLFFRDKKVEKVEDFKGMKVRASAPVVNEFYEKLGATPIAVAAPELYMSVDKKIIDGYSTAWSYVIAAKLYDVTKYCMWDPPTGIGNPTTVMSKAAWDKLPADLQKIVEQCITDYKTEMLNFYKDKDNAGFELLKSNGVDVYSLPDSEIARFKDVAAPIIDNWIAEREAKGLPAKAMVDDIMEYLASHK
jgi:TRAP-type C4-dicarboxylate transport system substrate-binding protein